MSVLSGAFRANVFQQLGPIWVIMRREIKDTLRDWRITLPICLLVFTFPFMAEFAASSGLDFVNRYGGDLILERMYPFLMLVVGFFPTTFSLVIALETFVGEKERRSLEPLLAIPFSDLQLYIGKLLASTAPPVVASGIGMAFYLLLLGFRTGWWPPAQLMLLGMALATTKALVMVTAAVIVSSQSTSVRAANLVASFIIVPMTFLLQVEAGLLLFANYLSLWLMVLGLGVVTILFVRMGVNTFNREQLLGREVAELDIKGTWQTFWQALWPGKGLVALYTRELPQQLRAIRVELAFTVAVTCLGGLLVGLWGTHFFPLPAGAISFNPQINIETFQDAVAVSGLLSSFSTSAIFWNNVRSLLVAAALALFTFGSMAQLLLMAPLAIISYVALQGPVLGVNPWLFLATFVLPHGILELPAAFIATAQALRIGAIILRPADTGGGVRGIVREIGHFFKIFIALVLPLLLLAAWIEINVTPHLVIWYLGTL